MQCFCTRVHYIFQIFSTCCLVHINGDLFIQRCLFSREYSILSKHPGMMWICDFILFFNGQTLVTSEQKLVWSFVFFFSSFNIFKCFHVSKQFLFSSILLSHSASIIFLVHSLHVVDEESEASWKSCKVQNYAK